MVPIGGGQSRFKAGNVQFFVQKLHIKVPVNVTGFVALYSDTSYH